MAEHQNAALRKEIGRRIRELRESAGVSSQEGLAERAGVHRTYVGRLERGETGVTVEALAAIIAPLGVGLAEFFQPFAERHQVRAPRRR